MSVRIYVASFAAALGLVIAGVTFATGAPVAGASAAVGAAGATATFAGHTIDLRHGWSGAHACLVWQERGVLECFSTEAQLQARETQLRSTMIVPNVTTCSSSLDLYSGINYSGLHLALWDEGYWQELSYDGFNKLTRSFIGGACGFHLAQGDWGQGWWYPGYTGPWAFSPNMGSWNNTISSVYIQ